MKRTLVVACMLGTAGVAWADGADDAIGGTTGRVQSALASSTMTPFHSSRDSLYQGIIGLQRVCDLYVTEYNDRKDFISRNTRAEDDAYSLGSNALNTLNTFATEGQRAALSALRERAVQSLAKHKQAAQDARSSFLRDWSSQAAIIKGAIMTGDLPQRLRDALTAVGYADAVKQARAGADAWFDADLGYLQSPHLGQMKSAIDQGSSSYKSILDSERSDWEQDVSVAAGRDDLTRCWPGE